MHRVVSLLLELGDDGLGESGRDRKADPDRAAGRRVDRRVDADDLAVHVEHRPAGIAAIDRGIGLQEIVIGARIDVPLARRENAGGDAAAQTERVADRQHPVADARDVAVAPGCRAQRLVGLDLQQRDIRLGVASDQLGLQIRIIVQNDGDFVGIGDHMIVGHDIARRIDDEARTERGGLARLRLGAAALGHAAVEEVAKKFFERRARRKLRDLRASSFAAPVGLHGLRRRDVDYRREKLFSKIGEAVGRCPSSHRSRGERRGGDDQQGRERPDDAVGQI